MIRVMNVPLTLLVTPNVDLLSKEGTLIVAGINCVLVT